MHDCIIIGGGPAGLTAAIYLARKKVNFVLLTSKVGGQILDGPMMENYPGFEKITGLDWVQKARGQAEKWGAEIKEGVEVKKISQIEGGFEIEAGEKFQAKTVLICSGKSPRKLNVPGEEKFFGKGISTCVTCDGPLFKEKTVAVIGGGNSAISAALELEKYVQKVYIINLGQELVGEEIRIEQIKKSPKIEIIGQAKTSAVLGENFVSGLKYLDLKTKEEKQIEVQGVFVEIGWVPSTGYLKGFVEQTPAGEIKIDNNCATNVLGVFAAGDVTFGKYKQTAIACGEGAKAALACWDYLTLKG